MGLIENRKLDRSIHQYYFMAPKLFKTPKYSRDEKAAVRLANHLKAKYGVTLNLKNSNGDWEAWVGEKCYCIGESFSHAIAITAFLLKKNNLI